MVEHVRDLGTIILRTDGKGLYTKQAKTFAVRVEVWVDSEIEFTQDGSIEFSRGGVKAFFVRGWDCRVDYFPYTDDTTQKGIQDFVRNLGYAGGIGWSEFGRQDFEACDFDANNEFLESVFPEVFDQARNKVIAWTK